MSILIGKIVKSSSHTDYVCQVYGKNEINPVPESDQYALGSFVSINLGEAQGGDLIGLVYDTVLHNPDFGRLGPRLSSPSELTMFTPDYLNERAVLLGITAIGIARYNGEVSQGVPILAAKNDAEVRLVTEQDIRHFHAYDQKFHLAYLPVLVQMDNPLAQHIGWIVLQRLASIMPEYAAQLAVLSDDLRWRTQIGPLGGM